MIKTSNSKVDLTSSKVSNLSQIQNYIQELKVVRAYEKCSNNQLITQNKRIMFILKSIQQKIDKQLQLHRKSMLQTNQNHKVIYNKDQMSLLQQKQANNLKLLNVLQKDYQTAIARKQLHQGGLEEKTLQKKHQLQDKINNTKIQIKQLNLQQNHKVKRLVAYQNLQEVDYMKEYARLQEDLRIYSARYVKMYAKYNKVTDQLAVASEIDPQFQIPQQIYNKQLQQKQQAQYKQYKSIVKLCTILSKRNDSQTNKSSRIYTSKLKSLQQTILHLNELQKSIAYKQTQILQGKKNIDIIRYKLKNQEKIDKDLFRNSLETKLIVDSLRQKSYSSAKLLPYEQDSNNKLRTRGLSFAKLPAKIKY